MSLTHTIQGSRPDPTLEYDVMDAATGAPMRITVATGVVAVVIERHGITVMNGDHRQQMGLFVPGLQPIAPGPDPIVVAELSLSQVGVHESGVLSSRMYGVGEVQGQIQPNGPQRFAYLSFVAVGTESMVLRYRVTLYRLRG